MQQQAGSSPGKTIAVAEQNARPAVKQNESQLPAILDKKEHSARKSHGSLIDDSLYIDRSQFGSSERSQSKNTTKREGNAAKTHTRMEIKENEYRKQTLDKKIRTLQGQVPEIINEKTVEDDQKSQVQENPLMKKMIQSADLSLISPIKSNQGLK